MQNVLSPKCLAGIFCPSILRIGKRAFSRVENLESVKISEGVTEIGEEAFNWCDALLSIELPSSINRLGQDMFFCCKKLQTVKISALTPPAGTTGYMPPRIFYSCTSLQTIYVPAESVDKYKAADAWKDFADKIQPIG